MGWLLGSTVHWGYRRLGGCVFAIGILLLGWGLSTEKLTLSGKASFQTIAADTLTSTSSPATEQALASSGVRIQCAVSPLEYAQPLKLTASFGEVRGTHFHCGWDFSTRRRVGDVVRSVRDGYIVRIRVGPSGYGRALFIRHADGSIAVYAHLLRFAWHIEKRLRQYQKKYQKNRVGWLLPRSAWIPVRAGEIIGFSGNTGISTGPHLHLEIRRGWLKPVPPHRLFPCRVLDSLPPRLYKLIFLPARYWVRTQGDTVWVPDWPAKPYIVPSQVTEIRLRWRRAFLWFHGGDWHPDDYTHLPYSWMLLQDDDTLFWWQPEFFQYDSTLRMATYLRWRGQRWLRVGFPMYGPVHPGVRRNRQGGLLQPSRGKARSRYVLILCDMFGNCRRFPFRIRWGTEPARPIPSTWRTPDALPDTLHIEQWTVRITGGVPEPVPLTITRCSLAVPAGSRLVACLTIENFPYASFTHPLQLNYPIQEALSDSTDVSGLVVLIRRNAQNQWKAYIAGTLTDTVWWGTIRSPGTYALVIDYTPPGIRLPDSLDITLTDRWILHVHDNLHAISAVTAYVNGEWYPVEWKPSGKIWLWLTPELQPGQWYSIILIVRDEAGNSAAFRTNLRYW